MLIRIACITVICSIPFVTPSAAEPAKNACMGLFDIRKDERALPEAHVNVGISDERSACFLVPRKVMAKNLRRYYGFGNSLGLHFDPADLSNFIVGKDVVKVGDENRAIDPTRLSCLKSPIPDAIAIMDGPASEPPTVSIAKSKMLALKFPFDEESSELRGYQRFVSERKDYREEYYFPDSDLGARLFIWCGPTFGAEMCTIHGQYDGMAAAIRYRRKDLEQVRPEKALDCVAAIGNLFRIDNQDP
jgi:hypothetical protein